MANEGQLMKVAMEIKKGHIIAAFKREQGESADIYPHLSRILSEKFGATVHRHEEPGCLRSLLGSLGDIPLCADLPTKIWGGPPIVIVMLNNKVKPLIEKERLRVRFVKARRR